MEEQHHAPPVHTEGLEARTIQPDSLYLGEELCGDGVLETGQQRARVAGGDDDADYLRHQFLVRLHSLFLPVPVADIKLDGVQDLSEGARF